MDQNVIDEPEEANGQQFLASNVDMADEIIEPNGGGLSPEINKSIEGNKELNTLEKQIAKNVSSSKNAQQSIDIYDNRISMREMKNIKQSVANDVKLLKNRVRMLQNEHDRAQKKIQQTTQKTVQLEKLKVENDKKVIREMIMKQTRAEQEKQCNGIPYSIIRKQQQQSVKKAKFDLYQIKKDEVQQVKSHLDEQKQKKRNDLEMDHQSKRIRSLGIKGQVQESAQHVREFQLQKKNKLKDQFQTQTEEEKRLIYRFEAEAQELEKLEERLIIELQETQDEEREAYKELEEAMVESSVGKKERFNQNGGFNSLTGSELPGLATAGGSQYAMRSTLNSFGAYVPGGLNKNGGRNKNRSGKSMRIGKNSIANSNGNIPSFNKTATGKMF